MPEPDLESPADHKALKALREDGALSAPAFWAGIRGANDPRAWADWAARLCLLIGATLVLAAIVFFFAFNWDGLGRLQKLGLLQGVTLLGLIGGQFAGFKTIGGKLLLTGAAVSVGVGFAVFGQVYQTGADAFGFFAVWAVCILPWVAAGAFAPLWVLWFTLLNLTAFFFWDQVGQFHFIEYTYINLVLTVINGCGLIAIEALGPRTRWLQGRWLPPLFLIASLTPLLIPALNLVLDTPADSVRTLLLGTALWVLCLAGTFRYFTAKRYDGTALSIVLANIAGFLLCGIGRLFESIDLYNSGAGFLFMALITAGMTALMIKASRALKQRYGNTKGGEQ